MARDQRRLAAIVSADVAGYSRLMGQDESATVAALKAHRQQLIDPKVAEYGGRIVKTTGDGLLLEFPSVVDAVCCAVEWQRGMAARNAGAPPDRRIDFRIGINVGDIIIDGDDIYGDGVNVAARLQALAEPGEIYVSKVVRDQVLDKIEFTFEDLGPQQVKNIARPVQTYRVDVGTEHAPGSRHRWPVHGLLRARTTRWTAAIVGVALLAIAAWTVQQRREASAGAPQLRAVAILPFTAADDTREAQRLADVLTADLTSARAKQARMYRIVSQEVASAYRGRSVDARKVGRELGALYLIEGQVRHAGEHSEVDVQVIETTSATQIWSDRVPLYQGDLLTNVDSAVARLDDSVSSAIFGADMRRFADPPAPGADAFALTMHAWSEWVRDNNTLRGAREARKWFDRALAVDPNFVPALVGRCRTLIYELDFDPHIDKSSILKDMEQLTFLAISVDNANAAAWSARAATLLKQGRWEAALEANAKAEKLSLSADNWSLRSEVMLLTGKPDQALALADRAVAMNYVQQEQLGWAMLQRCRALMALGRYAEAVASCERNVALDNWWFPHLYLVAGYALEGEAGKAATEKTRLLELRPEASIADLKRYNYSDNPAFVEQSEAHLLAGLRRAGLPEQ